MLIFVHFLAMDSYDSIKTYSWQTFDSALVTIISSSQTSRLNSLRIYIATWYIYQLWVNNLEYIQISYFLPLFKCGFSFKFLPAMIKNWNGKKLTQYPYDSFSFQTWAVVTRNTIWIRLFFTKTCIIIRIIMSVDARENWAGTLILKPNRSWLTN